MEFHFTSKLEEYYQKFVDLQEKLKKSEEERFILEKKFNDMVHVAKEEEQAHYRKLRSQYKRFLEEDKKRQDRNERIIRNLERIETRISMLSAKTDRINLLRRQYHNFLLRIANPNRERKLPDSGISRERSFIREEPLKSQQGPLFRDDYSLPTKQKDHIDIKQPLFEHPQSLENNNQKSNEEKIEILDRYLQSISTQRCRDLINQDKPGMHTDTFQKDDNTASGNHAAAIADDIMNSIYSRYYNKGENSGNNDTDQMGKDVEPARNMNKFKSQFGDLDKTCDNDSLGQHRDNKSNNVTKPSVNFDKKVDTFTKNKPSEPMENQINVKDQVNFMPSPTKGGTNAQHKIEKNVDEAETVESKTLPIIPNGSINIQQPIIDPIDSSSKENIIHIPNEYPQTQIENTKAVVEEMYQQPDNEGQNCYQQLQYDDSQANNSEVYQQHDPTADYYQQSQPIQSLENQGNNVDPLVNFDAHQQPLGDQNQEVYDQSQEAQHDHSENGQMVPIGQIQESNYAELENNEHQPETALPNDQGQVPQAHSVENDKHIENEGSIIDQQNELNQEYNSPTQFDPKVNPTQYVDENGQPLEYDPSYDQQQFDENGQPIHYDPATGYDQYGQPILYDQHGQIVQPQYDENGQIVPQYDENAQLIILYDQSGNVYGHNEQQQYDTNGQVYEQYDQNLQYDENGQPIYDPSYNYSADPNQQGYEADPNQQGYEADPNQQKYESNPNQQGYEADPNQQGYQADPNQLECEADPNQQKYEADPNQQGCEADPNQQGYEACPNQQGYEAGPNQQKYEADPNQQKYDDQYRAVDDHGLATVKDDDIVDEGENHNKDEGEIENDNKDEGQEKHKVLEAKDKSDVEKVAKVMDILDTDTESTKQNTSKISNDTDFDFS